jgi:hypothetical protein
MARAAAAAVVVVMAVLVRSAGLLGLAREVLSSSPTTPTSFTPKS